MFKKFLLFLFVVVVAAVSIHAILSYRTYNVILITIDTQRHDYLSCYDPRIPPTPNIDRLARDGVLFRNAYCLIPITLASHTSILTSRMPHETGVFNNGDIFDHRIPMVSDLFRMKGYQTAAFVSLGVLKSEFGLGSGFSTYQDDFEKFHGRYYKYASEVNEEAFPWLEKMKNQKFFAWIHYSDPHEPYAPIDSPTDTRVSVNGVFFHDYCIAKKERQMMWLQARPGVNRIEFRALVKPGPKKIQLSQSQRYVDQNVVTDPPNEVELRYGSEWENIKLNTGQAARTFTQTGVMEVVNKSDKPRQVLVAFSGGVIGQRLVDLRSNYLAEVNSVDAAIGQLREKLKQLKLQKKTILVVTADHGEGLKTHGILGHTTRLWNEIMQVPLIIYYPGGLGRQDSVCKVLTNHLDVTPTLLDLAHIKTNVRMDGTSLKRYVSRSPVDWLLSPRLNRTRTYAATYAPEARVNSFGMIDGNIKLIDSPNREKWKWEAYDLAKDPGERKNLVSVDPDRFNGAEVAALRRDLEVFRTKAEAAHSQWRSPNLTDEQREMLRGLGYLTQ